MKNETWLGVVRLFGAAALVFALGCGGNGGGGSTPKDGGTNTDVAMGNDARGDADAASVPIDASVDLPPSQDATTPVRLQLSETSLKLSEGSPTAARGTFFVSLSRPWSTPIFVTVLSTNPNVASVMPQTLEFPANSTDSFTVTVDALEDDDTTNGSATIVLSSIETGSASVTVAVDDTDVQGLLALPPRLAITEGRSEPLTVRLAYRPASAVVVTVASSNVAKLTVGTPSLTFTPSNYAVPQTVVLTAAQDDDAALDNVTVNLTPTGSIPAMPVPVEITDDDAVNLDVTPGNLALMERATTPGTVTVSLTRPPAANVTVMITSSNPAKATVSPATLTFTPANSATPQTVQVMPLADDDGRDENVTLTFVAAGISPAPPSRTVVVAIDDPDSQTLQVTPTMLSVTEGATATFDVRLTLNPGAPVTVTAFSQNSARLQVTPPVLSFNAANFATPQTLSVKALDDDDLANDQVNVTLTGSSAENVNVPVSITDDDKQAIQLLAASPGEALQMQETQSNGPPSTSPVGVRLAFRPTAPVTVLLTSGDTGRLGVSRSSLVFSPADYSTAQFVTLTAPHDDDMVDNTVELSATSTGLPLAKLAVEIRDMDVLNFNVSAATPSAILVEGQTTDEGSATFTVKLTVVPENPITPNITVTTGAGKANVNSGGCTLAGTTALTTGCTVTVTAVQDDDARDDTVTVTVADPAGVLTPRTVNFTVDDRDTQGLSVATATGEALPNPMLIAEGGTTGMFKVALTADPITPVDIVLTSSLANHVAFSSPCTLNGNTFTVTPGTGGTWRTGCVVTVTGLQDDDLLEQNLSVRVSATGLGVSDVFVNVRKADDDTQLLVLTEPPCNAARPADVIGVGAVQAGGAPVTVSNVPVNLTEGGTATKLCVSLRYQPDVNNTVTLTSAEIPLPSGLPGPNFTVSPSMLSFNPMPGVPGGYNYPQEITISPVEDNGNTDTETQGRITASVTPFALPRTLAVAVEDNDRPQVILFNAPATTAPMIQLEEQKQAPSANSPETVQVSLLYAPHKADPTAPASFETITVVPSTPKISLTGSCTGSATPLPLTFSNTNWMTAQTVTITPCLDDDGADVPDATLTFTSDRQGLDPVAIRASERTISVNVRDRDEVLTVTATEGGRVDSSSGGASDGQVVNCRAASGDCSGTYGSLPSAVTVTLTAAALTGWEFAGWSGSCTGMATTTTVTMSTDRACTATFQPRLRVTVTGGGAVSTVAPSTGIDDCRSGAVGDCEQFYPLGTNVNLQAAPDSGWAFTGWTGCVASPTTTNPLTVGMTQAQTCTATFSPILSITVAGAGTGTVTGAGISCTNGGAGTCSAAVTLNSTANLMAAPATGSAFAGWSGTGCGASVSMSQPRSCTATFDTVIP